MNDNDNAPKPQTLGLVEGPLGLFYLTVDGYPELVLSPGHAFSLILGNSAPPAEG